MDSQTSGALPIEKTADSKSQASHTPGPWKANFPTDQRGSVTITTENPLFEGATLPVEVARIHGRLGHQGDAPCGNYRANARLIAAAPDMLAALKFVKEFFRKMEDRDLPGDPLIEIRRKYHAPIHAQLDAAIAKAERGQ